MNVVNAVTHRLPMALLAGVLGLAAMEVAMWLVTRKGWAKGNMVVALGSLITGQRHNAFAMGSVCHVISAVVFALLYFAALTACGINRFPMALMAGIGFGLLHGMVVTLALVWIVSDRHPLEEFQDAGFAVAVSHIIGHAAYGAAVGAVFGLSLAA